MIPWFIVALIDRVAWRLGYQTYVRAVGGAGWHRGRVGPDAIYFIRRDTGATRLPVIKAR